MIRTTVVIWSLAIRFQNSLIFGAYYFFVSIILLEIEVTKNQIIFLNSITLFLIVFLFGCLC